MPTIKDFVEWEEAKMLDEALKATHHVSIAGGLKEFWRKTLG
jgi:hypothetical protein